MVERPEAARYRALPPPAATRLGDSSRPSTGAGTAVPIDPSDLQSRSGTSYGTLRDGTGIKIGYARVSMTNQDLTASATAWPPSELTPTGVHVDHGLTGTTRARPASNDQNLWMALGLVTSRGAPSRG